MTWQLHTIRTWVKFSLKMETLFYGLSDHLEYKNSLHNFLPFYFMSVAGSQVLTKGWRMGVVGWGTKWTSVVIVSYRLLYMHLVQ